MLAPTSLGWWRRLIWNTWQFPWYKYSHQDLITERRVGQRNRTSLCSMSTIQVQKDRKNLKGIYEVIVKRGKRIRKWWVLNAYFLFIYFISLWVYITWFLLEIVFGNRLTISLTSEQSAFTGRCELAPAPPGCTPDWQSTHWKRWDPRICISRDSPAPVLGHAQIPESVP